MGICWSGRCRNVADRVPVTAVITPLEFIIAIIHFLSSLPLHEHIIILTGNIETYKFYWQ